MWAKRYLFLCILGSVVAGPAASAGDDAQACLDAAFYEGLDPIIDICSRAIDAGTRDKNLLVEVTLKRGEAFFRAARLPNALSDVEAALEVLPEEARTFVLRAKIHMRSLQYGPAARDVMRAIALNPGTRDAYLLLGTLLRMQNGNSSHAQIALQQEVRNHPDNWFARIELADCLVQCVGRIDEGLAEIDKVVAAGPEVLGRDFIWHLEPRDRFDVHAYAMLTRAKIYRQVGKVDRAEADLDWLIEHWPTESRFFGERGLFFYYSGRGTKALADFEKALALASDYEEARFGRLGQLMAFNRNEEALAEANILIAGSSMRAEAFEFRSDIYKKLGKREAALADLDEAFSQNPRLLLRYQQRLAGAGYFQGQPDGVYNEVVRNGARACLIDPRC